MFQTSSALAGVIPPLISAISFLPFYIILIGLWLLITIFIKPYRRLAAYVAYLKDPEIGDPISSMAAAQIRDFPTIHERPESVQVACLRFIGPLKYDEIKTGFLKRVVIRLDRAHPNPTLEYPELQKYVVNVLGYMFLKKDKHFNLDNHFSLYNPNSTKGVTRNELIRIWESLLVKPFPKNKSPWEILIVDNYIPDNEELEEWNRVGIGRSGINFCSKRNHYWVGFLRMHHVLGDGFSIMKMLSHLSETEFTPFFPVKLTPFQKFMWHARTVLLGPYDALVRLIRQAEGFHALHKPYSKHARESYVIESPMIATKQITRLKLAFKVPYTVILLAAISGGLRRFYKKYNHEIPGSMSTALPVAIEDHSGKLGNEYSLAVIPYAVHLNDPRDRVKFIYSEIKSLASSSWIEMFDLFLNAYTTLPNSWLRSVTEKSLVYSSTYSTMPGPTDCIKAFESTMLEATYAYGTSPDSAGFGISSLTYNGFFRFVFFVDKNLVQSLETAEEIVSFIHEELTVLEKCCGFGKMSEVKQEMNRRAWSRSLKYD